MIRQILILAVLVTALTAALVYSQLRSSPAMVSGIIEADEIRLGSRVGGRVEEVLVEEGDAVAAGQPLVRLDPYNLDYQIAQADANLAAAEADLERLKNGFRPQEIAQAKAKVRALQAKLAKLEAGPLPEEIAVAEAQLELAKAQLNRATSAFQRVQRLVQRGEGTLSQDEIDRVTEEYQAAQALVAARTEQLELLRRGTREEDLAAARAELDAAQQELALLQEGFRAEEIKKAEAAVAAARAALEALKKQREELIVQAPVDGIVSALDLRPGDLVAPQTPVLTLQETRRVWVRAYVPLPLMQLRLGDHLPVTVDSLPGQVFEGEVIFISPEAEFTPRNVQTSEQRAKLVYRIKVMLPEDEPQLRPGIPADVWLQGEVTGKEAGGSE